MHVCTDKRSCTSAQVIICTIDHVHTSLTCCSSYERLALALPLPLPLLPSPSPPLSLYPSLPLSLSPYPPLSLSPSLPLAHVTRDALSCSPSCCPSLSPSLSPWPSLLQIRIPEGLREAIGSTGYGQTPHGTARPFTQLPMYYTPVKQNTHNT